MSWFNFLYTPEVGSPSMEVQQRYAPVRRKIIFPSISENLKVGDWIHLSLLETQVGKVYTYDNEIVSSIADPKSYIVTYETSSSQQVTYSYIDSNNNLYFKSLTDVSSGQYLTGEYFIYYHYDNLQFLQFNGTQYEQVQATAFGGFMASDSVTLSGPYVINKYSNVVNPSSTNIRVASLSYISTSGAWNGQDSNAVGNRVLGSFDGPKLKVLGNKKPSGGKASIRIVKTSSSGIGQSVIYEGIIDFYSANELSNTLIYSFDASQDSELLDPLDVYGSFSFEIQILDDKNILSTGKNVSVNQYSFSKNYNLSIGKEEIYENIVFISSGVIR